MTTPPAYGPLDDRAGARTHGPHEPAHDVEVAAHAPPVAGLRRHPGERSASTGNRPAAGRKAPARRAR